MKKIYKTIIIMTTMTVVAGILMTMAAGQVQSTGQQTDSTREWLEIKTALPAAEYIAVIPDTLWQAFDSGRHFFGLVFRVFPRGYKDLIPITVGIDTQSRITNVLIQAQRLSETPGLGARVAFRSFLDPLIGRRAQDLRLRQDGGSVDAVSGATISSRAVVEGIRRGYEQYSAHMIQPDIRLTVMPGTWNLSELIPDTLWLCHLGADTAGVVFRGFTMGYLDTIVFLAGVARDGKITGVSIISSRETEGIGERIREPQFLARFRDTIPDIITGATMSSRPFIRAVYQYRDRFRSYWSK